ncbi:MAG: hypothetical protein OSJ29_04860, partial [Alistipes sp.]|nr:hypothetical protein [Alistipes sp.]
VHLHAGFLASAKPERVRLSSRLIENGYLRFHRGKDSASRGQCQIPVLPGPACSAYGGWGRILSVFGFLSLFDRNMAVIGFPVGLAGSVRSNPENSVTFALHKLFAGVRPGHVAEVCMFVAADN